MQILNCKVIVINTILENMLKCYYNVAILLLRYGIVQELPAVLL